MNYQEAREKLARIRLEAAAALSRHQEHVGRQLVSLHPKDLDVSDLESLQVKVRERILFLLEERRRLGEIIQHRSDLQKIDGRLHEVGREQTSAQARATSLYPAFGRIVRSLVTTDTLPDSCRELWSQVENAERDAAALETRLQELGREARSASVVKRTVMAGKLALLKGKLRAERRRGERLQTLLGACVFDTDLEDGLSSVTDDVLVGQVLEMRALLRASEEQAAELEHRRAALLSQLRELGGTEPAGKREMALTQKKLETRVVELHTELGRLYVGLPLGALVKGRDLEKALDRIKALENLDSTCEELENRLGAALEVDRAESLIEESRRQIEELRNETRRIQTDIERLDKRIGLLKNKADHATEIRGAVDSLVSEVEAVFKSKTH